MGIQSNVHFSEPLEAWVRVINNPGNEMVRLRIYADDNMVDLFFTNADDAYELQAAVEDLIDSLTNRKEEK